jgi:hypothetical protein
MSTHVNQILGQDFSPVINLLKSWIEVWDPLEMHSPKMTPGRIVTISGQ